jgi:hypothetical protein
VKIQKMSVSAPRKENDVQPQEEKPFKMPIAWMKEGAPPEKPIQHAILGFAWMIVFICAKVMQAAKFDIWTILVSQVVIAESIIV